MTQLPVIVVPIKSRGENKQKTYSSYSLQDPQEQYTDDRQQVVNHAHAHTNTFFPYK